jgi:hypothetical protein
MKLAYFPRRRLLLVALVSLVGLGCGDVASSPDAGASSGGGGGDAGAGTATFDGVFHLPDQVDAANLAFLEDGLLVWAMYGCDFCAIDGGVWEQAGETLVLTPFVGQQTMPWIHDGSFTTPLTSATASLGPSAGEVTIEGTLATDGSTFQQVWTKGRVCAHCTGEGGPSGTVACDVPFSQAEPDACAHD